MLVYQRVVIIAGSICSMLNLGHRKGPVICGMPSIGNVKEPMTNGSNTKIGSMSWS